MGKASGFMEYERKTNTVISPKERIQTFEEFHVRMEGKERKKQAARCMDCGVPFCQSGRMIGRMTSGCPLNNLIPEWNDLLYTDNLKQALPRLRKTDNFPEFTARVCPAPCEAACTCGLYKKPVSIKENELTIIEEGYEAGLMKPNPPKVRTGKRVAVVGSGPSGLAAADQLNRRGHRVTVLERSDRIGGLLMYGIPNMKLEKHIITRTITRLEEEGISFVTNTDVGKDVTMEELKSRFDCIILCCGASKPRNLAVKGRDAKGIYYAVDYLKSVTKSLLDSEWKDGKAITAKGKRVLVIGGGDTGNDCVGTAIRQHAKGILQLEMMPMLPKERLASNPWPEWPMVCKTDYGQEEAIAVFGKDPRVYQTTVKEFIQNDKGEVCKAVLIRLEQVFDKETSRMVMKEVKGSQQEVACDLVFIAAGFLGAEEYVTKAFGLEIDTRSNVKTKENSYETSVEGIYVAGDMHRGQSLVVWAIREGREVAKQVDKYLIGYSNLG